MNLRVDKLKRIISSTQRTLDDAKGELENIQRRCRHDWDTKYTPDCRKAYIVPADPPGTMGVDRRPEVHVPSETTPKWTRTCLICGKQETTTRATNTVLKNPDFR